MQQNTYWGSLWGHFVFFQQKDKEVNDKKEEKKKAKAEEPKEENKSENGETKTNEVYFWNSKQET